jgi:hypothetical protein
MIYFFSLLREMGRQNIRRFMKYSRSSFIVFLLKRLVFRRTRVEHRSTTPAPTSRSWMDRMDVSNRVVLGKMRKYLE